MQCLRQAVSAVDLQLVSRLLLELAHPLDHVPGEHRGVLPARIVQSRGRDILGLPVELGCHEIVGISDLRPVVVHHRVGGPAEENRLRAGEPGVDNRAEVLVDEWDQPTASREAASRVFVRTAGALHYTVDGEERMHSKPHGALRSVRDCSSQLDLALRADVARILVAARFAGSDRGAAAYITLATGHIR